MTVQQSQIRCCVIQLQIKNSKHFYFPVRLVTKEFLILPVARKSRGCAQIKFRLLYKIKWQGGLEKLVQRESKSKRRKDEQRFCAVWSTKILKMSIKDARCLNRDKHWSYCLLSVNKQLQRAILIFEDTSLLDKARVCGRVHLYNP